MDKVYKVCTSKGKWDSYRPITIAVCTSMREAEIIKVYWLQMVKDWKNKYSEEQQQQLAEEWKTVSDDIPYIDSPEHLKEYDQWVNDQGEYEQYSDVVKIEEIELNKIIYTIE